MMRPHKLTLWGAYGPGVCTVFFLENCDFWDAFSKAATEIFASIDMACWRSVERWKSVCRNYLCTGSTGAKDKGLGKGDQKGKGAKGDKGGKENQKDAKRPEFVCFHCVKAGKCELGDKCPDKHMKESELSEADKERYLKWKK